MNAGTLRHRVTYQKPTYPMNAGVGNETWSDYVTIDASIEPLRGREYWQAQQINSEITAKIRHRWIRGITPNMRIKYGNIFYEIVSIVDKDMRNIEHEVMVTERVDT